MASRRTTKSTAQKSTPTKKGKAGTPKGKKPGKPRRSSKSGATRPSRTRTFLRAGGALSVTALTLFALWMGLAYLAVVYEVRDRMAGQRWEVPTKLYPQPLVLSRGQTLPPGDLGDLLDAMGYARRDRVKRAGEYRPAGKGRWYVFPFEGPAQTNATANERLDISLSGRKVSALKGYDSKKTLSIVEIPGLPFAEIQHGEREARRILKLEDFPQYLQDAVVAIEDRRFYSHGALDPIGITRAIVTNVTKGGIVQGGSTLTQQTAKNFFLTQERTFSRKFREVLYSVALERNYSKSEILELYLNEIYLGQQGPVSICGFGEASYHYFSKEPSQLSLSEAALLAGMIQAPNGLNPERHLKKATKRRDVVLAAMAEQGFISDAQKKEGQGQGITLRKGRYPSRVAPWFTEKVLADLGPLSDPQALSGAGFKIQTTLDWRIQKAAERALNSGLQRLGKADLQGAVVVLSPSNGQVLALVGGRDFEASQFNRALSAKRQPGSAFKPLVFAAAFEELGTSFSPGYILSDEALTLSPGQGKERWSPQNFDRTFRGDVTARQTLEASLNVPTVRLAERVGINRVVDIARHAGIESACADAPALPFKGDRPTKDCTRSAKGWQHPSLALGSKEVTPLELAAAYTAIATDGRARSTDSVTSIRDRDGARVTREGAPPPRAVIEPEAAWMLRHMLRGVVDHGTAKSARKWGYQHPAAGKTGTTNEGRDAWFVGFDADYLVVVWVGYDDNRPTGLTGGSAAVPIWAELMKSLRGSDAPQGDSQPPRIVTREVCSTPPLLDCHSCEETREEVYWRENAPARDCSDGPRILKVSGTQVRSWLQRFLKGIGSE